MLTIRAVQQQPVRSGSGQEMKWCLFFREDQRGLILNRTNATTIGSLYGSDTNAWLGKPVTLYLAQAQVGSDIVPALRVRAGAGSPRMAPSVAADVRFGRPVDARSVPDFPAPEASGFEPDEDGARADIPF